MLKKALILFSALLLAGGILFFVQSLQRSSDPYLAFLLNVYDEIDERYWEGLSEQDLSLHFKNSINKITGQELSLQSQNREGLERLLKEVLSDLDEEQKKTFSVQLADLVLATLRPQGRSRLYTQQDQEQLSEMVQNIDPETKEKQPTVIGRVLENDIAYLSLTRFSPSSLEELQKVANSLAQKTDTNTLIFDLRGNIGGSIDLLPYLLGPFIGPNQYAYEIHSQGEAKPIKTKTGWLPSLYQYKQVVVLIDERCQSSAEVTASVLKKYNVGVLLGRRTKGWGTIEKVMPLENQLPGGETHSIFLVHSLTLREDGQPIEGRGIDPIIDIDDPNWPDKLMKYYPDPKLIENIKNLIQT